MMQRGRFELSVLSVLWKPCKTLWASCISIAKAASARRAKLRDLKPDQGENGAKGTWERHWSLRLSVTCSLRYRGVCGEPTPSPSSPTRLLLSTGRLREFSLLLPPSTSCAKRPFLGGVLSRSYLRLPWAETSAVVFAVFLTRVPFRVCPGLGCRLSHGRARGGGRRGGFSLRASTSGRTSYRHHTKSEYFFVFESTAAEPRVPGS